MPAKHISASLEDYLETIYDLNRLNVQVRVTDIANELKISKPSVHRAIKILKTKELVTHESYGTVLLTQEGIKIAQTVKKKHMLLKTFLKDVLGVPDETAEKEACLIEHHISPDTVNKLSDYLQKILPLDETSFHSL